MALSRAPLPALAASESWFRTLLETTSTSIFVYRERFLYGNRAFTELCGYRLEELLEMDPVEIVHPDFRATIAARRRARLSGESVPRRYEILILTRAGEERWVDFSAGRIEFEGEPAALGTAVDVTDRKRAELALRQSEERLSLAQRAADAVTWDWNLLTDELVLSPHAAEALGIAGLPVPDSTRAFMDRYVLPEDRERVLAAVRGAIHGGGDYAVEHRIRLGDGRVGWLSERGRAIRDESGWVVRMVGVTVDVTARKRVERALKESNERLRVIIEQMPAIVWTTDRDLIVTSSVGSGLGALDLEPNQQVGSSLLDRLGTDDPDFPPVRAHLRALEGEATSYEQAWAGKAYQAHVEPLRGAGGEVLGTIGIALDVTAHRRAEEDLFRERERTQTTLASLDEGVIRTDAEGRVDYLNPVAERLTGFSTEEARGRPLTEVYRILDEASRAPAPDAVARSLAENRPVMLPRERVLVPRDGGELYVRDSAAPIRDREGTPVGAVLVFSDVTAVRDMEREMTYIASHDGLTGLLNRAEFERRLARALEASASGPPCAVAQIDLARFKVVNDTCGHLAGDEMLKRVARELRSAVAPQHAVARLGTDEFGLLLTDCAPDEARRRCEAIRASFDGFRFTWQDRSFEVGASIGLVSARSEDSVGELMIAVDTACMLAKESGRNRLHEYQPDDRDLAARYREMHWIHRIYKAQEEGRFRLYCQPVQPLGERRDEEGLLGEVLVRMVGEDGRLILPRTFVPAAERYRLISTIDRWVVRRSFELLAGGAAVGGRRLDRLALNLSGESLAEETFLDFVLAELAEHGIEADRILFEITETAAIANLTGAMRFISELRRKGACFVLDDFGSGLSSFAYLKNLPVDYLKIAGEFVRGVREVPIHRTLVRSINQIGHDLGLKTIAEGVEDEETLRTVEELQLDYAQGYWIAHPAPLERA